MVTTGKSIFARTVATLVATVFISELALMAVLLYLPLQLSTMQAAFLDAITLATICTVAFWFTVAKPLKATVATAVEKFDLLLEASANGVVAVNEKGQIRLANRQVQALFLYPPDELIGKPVEFLMPERFAESHAHQRTKYMGAPSLRNMGTGMDLYGRRADGSEFPVDVSLNHISTPEGLLVICSIRDVSGQRRAHEELQEANRKLNVGMSDIKRRSEELRRLSELGELLQGCVTEQEAYAIISRVVERQLPGVSGGLYLANASRDCLQLASKWGDQADTHVPVITPDDCWALRRGRIHAAEDLQSTIQCNHMNPEHNGYMCIPLLAQGELLGILHVFVPLPDGKGSGVGMDTALESKRMLLIAVSEQIALALANLRLREELRSQSIRDSLTGLFNRRFMEEALDREMLRASQSECPLSLAVIDLDHFKRFNDSFGHEGGDLVLREIGELLREQNRGSDLACRLGGEELVVIFPETAIDDAVARAEAIRHRIEGLTIVLRGQPLGKITASFGVAEYPRHGPDYDHVLRAADLALYQAKAGGRNRVVVAEEVEGQKGRVDSVDTIDSVPGT